MIVLVEHPPAMLRALRESLSRQPGLRILGAAGSLERSFTLAARLKPDVVVLDAEIAGLDVSNAVSSLRCRAPASALVLVSIEPDRLTSMVRADDRVVAVGKVDGAEGLLAAIHRAGTRPSS